MESKKLFKIIKKLFLTQKYVILLLLVSLILFSAPLLTNTLWKSELTRIFLYYHIVSYETAKEFGEIALWNPLEMSGHPFLGSSQIHIFYPLIFPIYFINPLYCIIPIIILHFFLTGFFTYLFCKKIHICELGAFIAGIIFMFSGPLVGRLTAGHMAFVYSSVWIPLLFLLVIKLCEDWRFFLPTAWVLAILFLAGAPQVFHFTLITIILFLLFYTFYINKNNLRAFKILTPVLFFLCALVVMFFIILFLLIPSITVSNESLRSGGTDFAFIATNSIHFESLINFIIPRFFLNEDGVHLGAGPFNESMMYIGIIPIFLSVLGLVTIRKNKILFFFLILIFFSILFALGRNTPLLSLLYTFIPGFNLFRVPSRILILFTFSLAIFAGFGTNQFINLLFKKKQVYYLILILIIVSILALVSICCLKICEGNIVSLFTSIFESKLKSNFSHYTLEFYLAGIPAMLSNLIRGTAFIFFMTSIPCVILLFYYYKKIKLTPVLCIVTSLIILDLIWFAMPLFELDTIENIYFASDSIKTIANDTTRYRVWDLTGDYPYWMTSSYNIPQIGGHEPLLYKRYKQLYNWMIYKEDLDPSITWFEAINTSSQKFDKNILNLLNVKYIFTNNLISDPEFTLINKTNKALIYENRNYLPRAFIVGAIRSTPYIEEELRSFDPKKEALIDGDEAQRILGSEFKETSIQLYSPNKIILQSELTEPGVLVLSELYFPGWRALDNGKEVPLFRINYVMRGVILSPGNHRIEIFFKPTYFTLICGISIISLIISLILAVYVFKNWKIIKLK